MTNELLLNTGGNPTPLEILNGIRLDSGGLMEVDNASPWIDSSAGGSFLIAGTVIVQNGGQITAACQQMTVSNGTFLANALDVGLDSGSQGTLIVAGGSLSILGYDHGLDQPVAGCGASVFCSPRRTALITP